MRTICMALLLVAAGATAPALRFSTAALDAQSPVRAFVGARLVDGTGAAPIDNATIVVRDGKVVAAGPSGKVTIPAGAERIDAKGKTVLPGFINAHGHVGNTMGLKAAPEFLTRENSERQLTLYARYGVTSVFSLGDEGAPGVTLRNEAPIGRARLFIAGPVISAPAADAARADAEKIAATGVDWLKFRIDDNLGTGKKMPKEAWKAVIDVGKAKKLPVAAHIFYLEDAKDALREGIDLIAHSVRDLPVDEEFIRLAKARDVCVCPTLMREVSTFAYESTPDFFSDPFFTRLADPKVLEQLKDPARQEAMQKSVSAQKYKAQLPVASANLKKLHDAGVRIAMGTDTGPPARFQGFFEHREMELMQKAGLTPMQVIVSATSDAARCMKRPGVVGTLQPGAAADLVMYRDDPSKDIRATRTIESVWVAGNRVP